MNAFVIILVLIFPNGDRQELPREWISASSASMCQRHADRRAEEARQQQADAVRRLGATVRGTCVMQGAML